MKMEYSYKKFIGTTNKVGIFTKSLADKYLKVGCMYNVKISDNELCVVILPNTDIEIIYISKQCFKDDIGLMYGLK